MILVPGLPSSLYFSEIFNKLANLNYNVLMFDFSGKMNSKLNHKADKESVLENFNELSVQLNLEKYKSWNIVGTSLGAILATQIALSHSNEVTSLSLLSPIGLKTDWTFMEKLGKVPVVSTLGALLTAKYQVHGNIKKSLACPKKYENLIKEQDQFLKFFNFSSKLNYLNLTSNYGMGEYTDLYSQLNTAHFKILITSGEQNYDHWFDQVTQLKSIVKNAKFMELKNVSHLPFIEAPQTTLDILLDNF